MRRRLRSVAVPIHRHALPQIALDAGLVALAHFLAYRLRFDDGVPERYAALRDHSLTITVVGTLLVFWAFGLYRHWWRYADRDELRARPAGGARRDAGDGRRHRGPRPGLRHDARRASRASSPPAGVIGLFFLLALMLTLGARFARADVLRPAGRRPRAAQRPLRADRRRRRRRPARPARDPRATRASACGPVGFVDDDPGKLGHAASAASRVHGNVDRPRRASSTTSSPTRSSSPSRPPPAGCARSVVERLPRPRRPGAHAADRLRAAADRRARWSARCARVEVEDVLGREPVRMEIERVGEYLTGRCVLVTGAGGSIGSELCRQIARVNPSRLVLVDHAEDNLFEIQRELEQDRHVLNAVAVIARLQGGGAHARGGRRAPPRGHLPRGRLQARRDDGGQPGRGRAQQRDRHAGDDARRGRPRAWRPSSSSPRTRRSRRPP